MSKRDPSTQAQLEALREHGITAYSRFAIACIHAGVWTVALAIGARTIADQIEDYRSALIDTSLLGDAGVTKVMESVVSALGKLALPMLAAIVCSNLLALCLGRFSLRPRGFSFGRHGPQPSRLARTTLAVLSTIPVVAFSLATFVLTAPGALSLVNQGHSDLLVWPQRVVDSLWPFALGFFIIAAAAASIIRRYTLIIEYRGRIQIQDTEGYT